MWRHPRVSKERVSIRLCCVIPYTSRSLMHPIHYKIAAVIDDVISIRCQLSQGFCQCAWRIFFVVTGADMESKNYAKATCKNFQSTRYGSIRVGVCPYIYIIAFFFIKTTRKNKYKQMYRIALNLETNMQYVQNRAY